jgi:cytidylate kinase
LTLPSTIAIDGPAASGKSTLGKKLADELGYLFFDTGVMYRAVTWAALEAGVPIEQASAIGHLAETTEIDIRPASADDGRSNDVLVNGRDITWAVRSPEVEAHVSQVAACVPVRVALTAQQRRIGLRGRVVMVGRDIGTVVMPDAPLKIYLDASAEARAQRRYRELVDRGRPADYAAILANVHERDHMDSTRENAPLRMAGDAVRIDSENLDVEAVFAVVKELVHSQCTKEERSA